MGKGSSIEWTHHTFNPWWGCARVSPACEHCYAETFAKRTGHDVWGATAERRMFGEKHWAEPRRWSQDAAARGVRERVFCASMADVFEDRSELEHQRQKLWALIEETPSLDWLLLTKRPENFGHMLPWAREAWPNVWLGVTVEDQRRADERIPKLLRAPAVVRFLSCEPLLEAVNLGHWFKYPGGKLLDWVIVGGESGHGARPMDPVWVRGIQKLCAHDRVPFLFKQWGEHDAAGRRVGKKAAGRAFDGQIWDAFPTPQAHTTIMGGALERTAR